MLYFSRLKTALVLGVCALGLLLCLPNLIASPSNALPWNGVRLGLDLRGGSYLLLEVDMKAVVRERLDSFTDSARQALRPGGIFYSRLAAEPDAQRVVIRLRDPARMADAEAALRPLTVDPSGGQQEVTLDRLPDDSGFALTLSPAALAARASSAVTQSIEIVRRRIDASGVAEPQITRQGDSRIVVQLPGVADPGAIKELLGKTAHMTFRMVDEEGSPETPPPGTDVLPRDDGRPGKVVVRKKVEVDGADLKNARAVLNQQSGGWAVSFEFNGAGTRRFAATTTANTGKLFAIVLDDKVVSAPQIREPITGGSGEITGSFTAAQANELSVLLRAGALPAPLTVVEERTVGPELGADSIKAAAISLAAGFILVIAYMGIFYGIFGWFANIALVFNLVLMLAVLSLIHATLTLPGMAGILLTLGMAVDANILINERVREESRAGRTPIQALEVGFKRAYATIFDSNATAFLAHVMLFYFGTGPVRGFAVTITVGIATTLFTAWLLTRLFVGRWYAAVRPAALPV